MSSDQDKENNLKLLALVLASKKLPKSITIGYARTLLSNTDVPFEYLVAARVALLIMPPSCPLLQHPVGQRLSLRKPDWTKTRKALYEIARDYEKRMKRLKSNGPAGSIVLRELHRAAQLLENEFFEELITPFQSNQLGAGLIGSWNNDIRNNLLLTEDAEKWRAFDNLNAMTLREAHAFFLDNIAPEEL